MTASGTWFKIQSRTHPYEVEVQPGLAEAVSRVVDGGGVFCLVDRAVQGLYPSAFRILDDRVFTIEATEEQKSYERITPLFTWLLEKGFRRDCKLLVVGGGVVQDIGCFIASVLFRGARWELIPTTLLAQCDSCIGSKSSINVGAYKNQIGTFYPPHRVSLVFDVLKTLPPDEIRSGLGEALKLALIAGERETQEMRRLLARQSSSIPEIVRMALSIKRGYIEKDELDRGIRNLLNYGHTFGHAYESATHYGIPHGIAVVLGMLTATFFSEKMGLVKIGYSVELREILSPLYIPYERELVPGLLDKILSAMKHDKKNTGGKIVCILTRGAGAMEKVPLEADTQVRPWMAEFLKDFLCRS